MIRWWNVSALSSPNLVIQSYVHHHHLPSDADPARATGVVGVHATPEPHLDSRTDVGVITQKFILVQ